MFACTVCRLRGRHAESSCPTTIERTFVVGRNHRARRCRNYEMRTNSPPMSLRGRLRPWQSRAGTTVCVQTYLPLPSAAARTARRGRRALRPSNAPHRRARPLGAPVQELRDAYKLPSHVIARALAPVAISRRNYRLRTNLFAPTVCRCADGTPRSSCPTTMERTPP